MKALDLRMNYSTQKRKSNIIMIISYNFPVDNLE